MKQVSKICKKCGAEKPPADFYGRLANKDGLSSLCKVCYKRQYENLSNIRNYYQRNRVRICEKRKKYRLANPQRIATQHKKWVQKNRDKVRANNRKHYAKYKELYKQKHSIYSKLNLEKVRSYYHKRAKLLTDGFLRSRIMRKYGLKKTDIDENLIAMERQSQKIKIFWNFKRT